MKKCTTNSDCIEANDDPVLENKKCQVVDGLDTGTYCYCNYRDSGKNKFSLYNKLISSADYTGFLGKLKEKLGAEGVSMAVIIGAATSGGTSGNANPDQCSSPAGTACSGQRYYDVAKGLGVGRFFSDSICLPNFTKTLIQIVQFLVVTNERPLSDKPADPTCIQVKVGGKIIPHCQNITTCKADETGPCPEQIIMCEEEGAVCQDKNSPVGKPCACSDFADTAKNCKCVKAGSIDVECKRPMFWQYSDPDTCTSAPQPGGSLYLQGCGLQAGDKLEISFLRASGSSGGGDGGVFKCGN
jgi:hypothetical protein